MLNVKNHGREVEAFWISDNAIIMHLNFYMMLEDMDIEKNKDLLLPCFFIPGVILIIVEVMENLFSHLF